MKTIEIAQKLNLEDLAYTMAESLSFEEIRQFVDVLCYAYGEYELDAGIYSDRVRDMKKCQDEGESFSHEDTLVNFPALNKED